MLLSQRESDEIIEKMNQYYSICLNEKTEYGNYLFTSHSYNCFLPLLLLLLLTHGSLFVLHLIIDEFPLLFLFFWPSIYYIYHFIRVYNLNYCIYG